MAEKKIFFSSKIFSHTLISQNTVDFIMIFKNSKLKIDVKLELDFIVTCSTRVTLLTSGKSKSTKFLRGK